MINHVDAISLVSQKVIDEEMCIVKGCSCCQYQPSTLFLIQCRGIAIVLEHVCTTCWKELLKLVSNEKELIKVAIVMK